MWDDEEEDKYGRVDIPADAECPPEIRAKWQGKIVGPYEYGSWGSLEGKQDEGICLTCPDEWVKPLSDKEWLSAMLMAATFWHRTAYTEDLLKLRLMPKD